MSNFGAYLVLLYKICVRSIDKHDVTRRGTQGLESQDQDRNIGSAAHQLLASMKIT